MTLKELREKSVKHRWLWWKRSPDLPRFARAKLSGRQRELEVLAGMNLPDLTIHEDSRGLYAQVPISDNFSRP